MNRALHVGCWRQAGLPAASHVTAEHDRTCLYAAYMNMNSISLSVSIVASQHACNHSHNPTPTIDISVWQGHGICGGALQKAALGGRMRSKQSCGRQLHACLLPAGAHLNGSGPTTKTLLLCRHAGTTTRPDHAGSAHASWRVLQLENTSAGAPLQDGCHNRLATSR